MLAIIKKNEYVVKLLEVEKIPQGSCFILKMDI